MPSQAPATEAVKTPDDQTFVVVWAAPGRTLQSPPLTRTEALNRFASCAALHRAAGHGRGRLAVITDPDMQHAAPARTEMLEMLRHAARTADLHHVAALAEINVLAWSDISAAQFRRQAQAILQDVYRVENELASVGGEPQ